MNKKEEQWGKGNKISLEALKEIFQCRDLIRSPQCFWLNFSIYHIVGPVIVDLIFLL